jgi:hypothetical protein
MNDIVEIASYGTTFAARAAVAHLASEGIKASVVTDNAGGAIPSMSNLSAGVRVVVVSDDAERASAILSESFTTEEVEAAEEAEELTEEGSNA